MDLGLFLFVKRYIVFLSHTDCFYTFVSFSIDPCFPLYCFYSWDVIFVVYLRSHPSPLNPKSQNPKLVI